MQVPNNTNFTPEQIRTETGLNLPQFKEAKKHPEVQNYFKIHIKTTGSGATARYTKFSL